MCKVNKIRLLSELFIHIIYKKMRFFSRGKIDLSAPDKITEWMPVYNVWQDGKGMKKNRGTGLRQPPLIPMKTHVTDNATAHN